MDAEKQIKKDDKKQEKKDDLKIVKEAIDRNIDVFIRLRDK